MASRRSGGHSGLPRLEIGRALARFLCALLALLGAVPFAAGLTLRSGPVRHWAATETARLVQDLVGVEASYTVGVQLLPLHLVLENISVKASDGGAPAFLAKRISVTPRLFSLLAGKLDAGDVEIQEPRARIVLEDGRLANVRYRLPESKGPPPKLERAPFASLSLTDATVSLDVDGVHADAGPLDLDVFSEAGPAFEVALRSAESRVTRTRDMKGVKAIDDDVLCELDTRLRLEKGRALVRRLSLMGAADDDPAASTFGSCRTGEGDPRRVAVRLSEVRATLDGAKPTLIDGHVVARAPLAILNRFISGPFRGWVGVVADVRWDSHADLPEVRGKIRGGGVELGPVKIVQEVDGDVEITGGEIRSRILHATYGHAKTKIEGASLKPFAPGMPVRVRRVEGHGLRWEDLMENIDITMNTIIQWNLDHVVVTDFGGTLDPPHLDGDVLSETTGFEVFDRTYRSPARQHMIGVHAATVRTRFGVRPDKVQFMNSRANFGSSEVQASVSVGFENDVWLSVPKGGKINLADISPLVDIPMAGVASVDVNMSGRGRHVVLEGGLSVDDLVFAGFPLGDVESSRVHFTPLIIDLSDVRGVKGTSRFLVPTARLDFDGTGGATLLADAHVTSDRLDLRDFFSMWHFDEDPRFAQIAGRGSVDGRLHYDMGGPKDKCGNGYLRVDGNLKLDTIDLYEEHYDSGETRFDFRWMDPDASYLGMQLDAPNLTLKKGSGTILGGVQLMDGARVRAHVVASGVPLSHIDGMGELGRGVDADASGVAEVSGTLDALVADVDAHVGPVRIGRATLPGSDMKIHLEPVARPLIAIGKTQCGRPMSGPFDPAEYQADRSAGVFHTRGQLLGGQIAFTDLQVTRQRKKAISGAVTVKSLDLGALAELSPVVGTSEERLEGRFSGKIAIDELVTDRPGAATLSVGVDELRIGRRGFRLELDRPARLALARGRLEATGVTLATTMPTGERVLFDLSGGGDGTSGKPRVDVTLAMRPTELAAFERLVPQADRLAGTLAGQVRIGGTWPNVGSSGRFTLERGELALRGTPVTLTNVSVAVAIEPDEIRIEKARASLGGGTLDIRGGAPLKGLDVGAARAAITARNVTLPLGEGVRATADADLALAWAPRRTGEARRTLPKLTGDVTFGAFKYTRKVTMAADIDTLTKRGHRTHFESYDPDNDVLEIEVRVRASRPLEIDNDLVEAKLVVADPGLVLSGTNQRFGMRGEIDVTKGGRIRLRRNEFEITQGLVRFDDEERIAPRVDVTAVTDYHRYDEALTSSAGGPAGGGPAGSGSGASTSAAAGGRWRITMHAHGDPETLRIDLSSEPALSQDDIFLLLTLGLTRAELDRAQSATAGGSVALEALGRLTGADEAVTDNIPVIDEFKLGSSYSSRTGRTEPTVTIGKRLAQRIRAYVTSGLTESREVRSNLEWRLSPKVSVEGSYDNVNDISSSGLGNLGADVRWRLEFE